ncbi:bifunctional non-homologous end joining protein LigD [Cryobacterium sp. MP_M5]|uniref:ATP-dependent DNA ligase n=1 Tax=unclassified Cryobacterium TaxID=2649013 RepID=UPI0018CA44F9|nr:MULTISPECIES: ATP-dependent DNA ligase [unclassified Cryobacterium]MBG6058377.1 bifunctional non-homologous end joining protein LigD [Cryobacterium sp. MP_M3]MEC5176971.1 bifunctional non-homologous end joining protein LigD [Cryobacterium sp. MP_M5]
MNQGPDHSASQVVIVDGHRITLTSLDKVLYPETGTTKADVIAYYAAVADVLIPHAANRPATRKRWVHGVGTAAEPGHMFFQKNLDASTPSWVARRSIEHSDHVNVYPLVNDLAALTWLGQIAALEIHVPQWQFGRNGHPRNPDRLVLDLDPGEGVTLAECAHVARLARAILRDMGLDAFPVTSGSKGIHLYAALDLSHTSDQVSAVAHELARALEADHPDLVVSDMKKARRAGRVFVDWSQNNAAKTTIAPYSLRGTSLPMVAMPRTWRELASPGLAQVHYRQAMHRVERNGDPLSGLLAAHPGVRTDIGGGSDPGSGSGAADRLSEYRSKRNSARTPEPVPAEITGTAEGRSFVIQEHHARNLHYDLRLEHDGVLAAWALPRGVPTEPTKNHLAVRTEDHPLEYGTFEGDIPAGEYGAGTVRIWDSGSYELEKWRDDEVIATLHGEPGGGLGGARRFALIHTKGHDRAENNWLIHLMKATNRRERVAPAPLRAATSRIRHSPMLATLGTLADLADADGRAWACEMKWDGIRLLASVTMDDPVATDHPGATVRLVTRNGNDVTDAYPELVRTLPSVVRAGSAVLDGEVVVLDAAGRPSFGLLQNRTDGTSVNYLVFDLLERDGQDLTGQPYSARREILGQVVHGNAEVQVPPAFDGNAAAALRASRELGLEGIVAKRLDGPYEPGRRSRSWIKIKHHATQEVVVGGWRPGKGHRAGSIGSLLVGIPEGGSLAYAGRVGTGFRDRDLDEIMDRLAPLATDESPFAEVPSADAGDANWVRPILVGEVEFAEWTESGRLRHPVWRGWRPDKAPADVVREGSRQAGS